MGEVKCVFGLGQTVMPERRDIVTGAHMSERRKPIFSAAPMGMVSSFAGASRLRGAW